MTRTGEARRAIARLLVMAMLLGMLTVPVSAASRYSDTERHWAESAIERWSAYDIVSGSDGRFLPDADITRGQMAKILSDLLGLTEEAENPFDDVSDEVWYAPYVLRCYAAGIMLGADGMANPEAPVTRQEAMMMIGRALGITPKEDVGLSAYGDADAIAPWAAGYVAALADAHIVGGVKGELLPLTNMSRASVMTVFDRVIAQYIDRPGAYELADKAGIVLVAAAGDVELTGTTRADVLVSPAGTGRTVAFDKATVKGLVTVQARDCVVTQKDSSLLEVKLLGDHSKVEEAKTNTNTTNASVHTHIWDAGTVTTAATCTEAGAMLYVCTACGGLRRETIAATGHSLRHEAVKAATCTEAGDVEYWHCETCGKLFSDAEALTEITADAITVAALGHSWDAGTVTTAATCAEAGVKTYTCGACGETRTEPIAALGHSWDAGIITRESAAGQAGLRLYTCARCGETRVEPVAETTLGFAYAAAGAAKETAIIEPQVVGDKTYLFLPASASYDDIYFIADSAAVLTGTVEGASLETTTDESETLDLTPLFGAMAAGEQYPLRVTADSETHEIVLMKSANLPSIHITLDESKLPEGYDTALAYIHANKSNKLPGNLVMVGADGGVLEQSLKQLKGRGNASWGSSGEKRAYNIKLNKKQELIDRAGSAKNWCLISNNVFDKTGIANVFSYNLNQIIGGASALSAQTIDLYINNAYRGTYFLSEKVEINTERVDILEPDYEYEDEDNVTEIWKKENPADPLFETGIQAYQYATGSQVKKPGGYIIEVDWYFHKGEASWFLTRRGIPFTVKEPEYASKEQLYEIATYVQGFEDALFSSTGYNNQGKYYGDYIDYEALVKLYALECFVADGDFMCSSWYFYASVDAAGRINTPLIAGPAWDFDSSLSMSDHEYGNLFPGVVGRTVYNKWAVELLTKGDFIYAFERFNASIFSENLTDIVEESSPNWINELYPSQMMNGVIWQNDYTSNVTILQRNVERRLQMWKEIVWSEESTVLGVTVREESETLKADVSGTATAYQWYRIDPSATTIPIKIEGATENTYTPTEEGVYYVAVTGGNIGYNQYAADHPERYTLDGKLSLVAYPAITMYSNPAAWGTAAGPAPDPGPDPGYAAAFVTDGHFASQRSRVR